MTALRLRYFPDPVLTQVCKPIAAVTPEIQKLARDMIETMMLEKGIGLAAPQIGHSLRIFVVDVKWVQAPGDVNVMEPHVFINPVLTLSEDVRRGTEGCLSFPEENVNLERAYSVSVSALNIEGEPFTMTAEGLLSIAIQHENDHLDGKTFARFLGPMKKINVRARVKKLLRQQR